MKVSLSTLKQFLTLSLSPQEIAEKLTALGIEVEKIEIPSFSFSGVVSGKVVETAAHPNADRLKVVTVSDGKETFQVVCGAPNCREGLVTAFAKIGASLTDKEGKSWKIKKNKLRDVESHGMLCSSQELGLSSEHEGIVELPQDWELGQDLSSFYADPIFELSLTPNLGHCLSALGIARELGAATHQKAKLPCFTIKEQKGTRIQNFFSVSVENKELCPRYILGMIQGVKVGPSPSHIVQKLSSFGIKSVNNVVDVCNLVMMELGQPLHVFDANKIEGKKIYVKTETLFKTLNTLDHKEHEIPPHAILICDEKKPLAFAGIMGGLSSAVSDSSQNLLIEAACFNPQSIRKTSRETGLRSDSSYRFERGVDPEGILLALNRALFLIQEIAGGDIVQEKIDVEQKPFVPKIIACRTVKINALLGTTLGQSEILSLLARLEIHPKSQTSEIFHFEIPSYRNDLHIEEDLIEEIARVFGYSNIEKKTPKHITSPIPDAPLYVFENRVRRSLLKEGLQECVTCDLISPYLAQATLEKGLPETATIAVLHPKSQDQSLLRTSLLPGLLQVVKNNFNQGIKTASLFEIGKIHFKEGDAFQEQSCVGIILTGKRSPASWDVKPLDIDFFDLKGHLENLFEHLNLENILFETSHLKTLHPWRQLRLKKKNEILGAFGEIHPSVAAQFDLKERLFFAEINLQDLLLYEQREKKCTTLPSFPGSERDWTLTLSVETPLEKVMQAIQESKSYCLEKYELIDLFTSEKLGEGLKNATFRFLYRDLKKTISLDIVEKEHTKITQAVAEKLRNCV